MELNKSTVLAEGMKYYRQLTFAQLMSLFPVSMNTSGIDKTAHKWDFITQRQYPLLAITRTQIWVPGCAAEGYIPDADEFKVVVS